MKAVILAGGFGTRLYPLSTKEKPKQFINLIGEGTLFQQTVSRLSFLEFLKPEDIFVATNKDYVHFVREQAPQIPEENIFVEPAMRSTAACIGYAAMMLSHIGYNNETMAVVYADHLIRNTEEFAKKLSTAETLAREENTLNIIEVEATSPNTNFGYVKIGKILPVTKDSAAYTSAPTSISVSTATSTHTPPATTSQAASTQVREFLEFKEKPDLETAKSYLLSGDYLWNTGIYVWRVSKILEALHTYLPDTYDKLEKIKADPSLAETLYPLCENISIDYAVMEKVDPKEVRIIPSQLGWSDIGNFDTLFVELEKSGEQDKLEKFKKIIADAPAPANTTTTNTPPNQNPH